ncbi:hypothetical protein [Celeribacter indicus]|uniref:O-antigen polymerase n=1 Tax=Celeribacter indicus TaxID=1208324 RepID=A0A0B5DQP6_9RHOB|nr:hypothetical protein [Celeribacter indicus]AJE45419.1 hypothetical protein P73_0704 [Celeribacter indicus]SDX01506.1 hypothetical protein SAMN05443573_11185 [Celeribacter indicus]
MSDISMTEAYAGADRSPRKGPAVRGIHRTRLLFYFAIAFILAPKVNIVSFGDSGLRTEDFILFAALPVVFWRYRRRAHPFPSYVWAFFAFMAASFLSAIVNLGEMGLTGLVFTGRQVQYFLWFLIAAEFAPRISEARFRRAFGIIASVLLVWWLGEASGLVPKIGRFAVVDERITLNTSGPYETAILAVLVLILAPKRWQKIGMIGVLLATQSRITIAAAIVVWQISRPARNTFLLLLLVPVVLLVLAFDPQSVSESRFSQTQSLSSMASDLVGRIDNVPQIRSLEDFRALVAQGLRRNVDFTAGDASFQVRAYKWALILKSLTADAQHLLLGWGPGAWGLAVDGHYVRFLGEGGLIGLLTALIFFGFSLLGRDSPLPYRLGFLTMALSCIFIDAAVASKVSSTLWIIAGYFHGQRINQWRQSQAPERSEP